MNFAQLVTLSFWFTLRPAPMQSGLVRGLLIAVPLLLIAFAVALPLLRRAGVQWVFVRKGSKVVAWAATLGLLAALFTFSRFEGIPFFAMRMWWVLWAVLALVWGYTIVKASLRIPGQRTSAQKHYDDFIKYLPR